MSVHFVAGPTKVKYGTSESQVELGYTRDGVIISIQPLHLDIPSDDWGGQSGAPSDVQLMGAIARINCDITKAIRGNIEDLTSFIRGGTKATLPAFGSLLKANSYTGYLVLEGTSEVKTFTTAFIRSAFEMNSGTRYRSWMVSFEAHLNSETARVMFADTTP